MKALDLQLWDWMGMTELRHMNGDRLRALDRPAIVRGRVSEKPLAVLIPYQQFMLIQARLTAHKRGP